MTKIEDAATDPTYYGAFNFKDGASQSDEYTYDKNGNMTKDLNKNISSIQYNSLNLPSKVSFSNGKYMDYVYSATGEKRSVTYNAISSGGNYIYCDNFIYYNDELNKILIDDGYISISGSTPTYHYYLKDHLGNNRVVVNSSGTVKQVTHYYPFGGFFGESTGSGYQAYKYNGKEFERLISEDWYDYGARHMDGMRFTTMDPMAEKYYSISPYAYCANNPVKFVDLHGDSLTIDEQSILALYNGLEDGSHIHMKFNNGVLDPSSISDAVSNSEDIFLQDLYEIAINPQMVEMKITDVNTYIMDGKYIQDETWTAPYDIDYSKEFPLGLDMPSGLTISGNTGQTLFPLNVGKGPKFSTNNNIQININGKSRNINHQTIGIGHEFGHVILFLRGKKYSHPDHDVDSFINRRVNILKKRFGYDN